MNIMQEWYQINNISRIDSPALVVYPDRIKSNIALAIKIAGTSDRLRPHVKTNKMTEVCRMMLEMGITKFKCATIAEAEMLAIAGAPDVLLAYQPVGPKVERLIELMKAYPDTVFSCLADDDEIVSNISALCQRENLTMDIFVDINVGMNRTGVVPYKSTSVIYRIMKCSNIRIKGLHGYDGHIHDASLAKRQADSDAAFDLIGKVYYNVKTLFSYPLALVMGGTPTFPMHARRQNCECSPGTFVFWDWGYKHLFEDMPFQYAALLVTRVISVIDSNHICTDLGHKSVAAENPLPRIHFINASGLKPVSQSEEHLVLETSGARSFKTGDVLYGVPVHICPTVALYERAFVVKNNEYTEQWDIIARNRFINH